jgi:hypothetical protein
MGTNQYVGRKFDLISFRGAVASGEVLLDQTLFGPDSSGEVCTGVQKLGQRWSLEFLTPLGSMGYHLANRGSRFMIVAKQGRLRHEADVQAQFNFASVTIRTNLLNDENDTWNPEDRFKSATLTHIVLQPGFLQMYVVIESQAGATREIILPIPITPIALN